MKTIRSYQQRKNIRLRDYDYSTPGKYFITICVKDRICSLGQIQNKKMKLNDIGNIAYEYWKNIPGHFPGVILHEFIIMPDHIHGIIEICGNTPEKRSRHVVTVRDANDGDPAGASHVMPRFALPENEISDDKGLVFNQFSKPIPGSVSVIIQQYKASVKRWCNKNNHPEFTWQSRFHEHIIRGNKEFKSIIRYISDNPVKWSNKL